MIYWNYSLTVPEGYDLIEQKEHKKERLQQLLLQLETRKQNLLQLIDETEEKLKEVKKEMKDLEK